VDATGVCVMAGARKPWHAGDYARRAAAVRTAAYGSEHTRCWRCGLTLEQVRHAKPNARWQAGHATDSEVGGLLLAECSPCNASSGASYGNAKREPRSRPWD
jgi:hypothetical protein